MESGKPAAQANLHDKTEGSDTEVESVDPSQDLVIFDDIPTSYVRDEDIFLTYHLGRDLTPSSRDWVGLYPSHWTSTSEYVMFEWAPKLARHDKFPFLRSVLFHTRNLSHETSAPDEKYQFLFVTKQNQVVGVSRQFGFVTEDPFDDLGLVCVERPLHGVESLTIIESEPRQRSLDSFEIVQTYSNNSSCCSSKSSGLKINQCLHEASRAGRSQCELELDLLNEDEPVRLSQSSDYNLDFLFCDSHSEKDTSEDDPDQYYRNLLVGPTKVHHTDPLPGLVEVNDGQWFSEVHHDPEQSESRKKVLPAELTVVLYESHDVVPYHQTALEVYRGAGPLLPYTPRIPIFDLTGRQTQQTTKNIPEVEDLLTPISTRRFKFKNDRGSKKKNGATQAGLGVEFVGRLTKFLARHTPTIPLELASPMTERQDQSLVCHGLSTFPTNGNKLSRKELVKIRRKKRCLKCKHLSGQLKSGRKCHVTTKRQLKKLQLSLAQQKRDTELQTVVMEELANQVKVITHDNNRLKVINTALAADRSAALEELVPLPSSVETFLADHAWLQQSCQALHLENSNLKKKQSLVEEELAVLKRQQTDDGSEWHMATGRKTARLLAMITSQEATIGGLRQECEALKERLQMDQHNMEELKSSYEASKEESEHVTTQVLELQAQLDTLQEKEASLERLLVAERRKKAKVYIRLVEERRTMSEQIQSLENALEAGKLIHQRHKFEEEWDNDRWSSHKGVSSAIQTDTIEQQTTSSQTRREKVKSTACQTTLDLSIIKSSPTESSSPSNVCAASVPMASDPAIIAVGTSGILQNDTTASAPCPTRKFKAVKKPPPSKNSGNTNIARKKIQQSPRKGIRDYCDDIVNTAWNSKQAFHEAFLSCQKRTTDAASMFLSEVISQNDASTSGCGANLVQKDGGECAKPVQDEPRTSECWADLVEREEHAAQLLAAEDSTSQPASTSRLTKEWIPKRAKNTSKVPGRTFRFSREGKSLGLTREFSLNKSKGSRRGGKTLPGGRKQVRREE